MINYPLVGFMNKIEVITRTLHKPDDIYLEELYDRFALNENSTVLDIGCGCGRLTFPFDRLIKNGAYVGIDV